MEVEFLSNMRYNLYVSEAEWSEWKAKLGKFGAFFEAASKLPLIDASKPTAPLTPVTQNFPNKLPSPPSTYHSAPAYPLPPLASTHPSLPIPFSTAPHLPRSPIRAPRDLYSEHQSRKRSLDPAGELPLSKRMFYADSPRMQSSMTHTPDSLVYTPSTLPALTPDSDAVVSGSTNIVPTNNPRMPRLPMPRIQTTMSQQAHLQPPHLAPLSLPANRAMSTVYPNASNSRSQPATPVSGMPLSNMNLYSTPVPNLGGSNYTSANASPIAGAYSAATPTRTGLSPSYFLTHRSSPYRPVRNVNTLLIPPPSTSLNNPSRNIGHDQIHYQPLSKTSTETKAGVVPYLSHDSWSQGYTMTPPVPPHYEFRA